MAGKRKDAEKQILKLPQSLSLVERQRAFLIAAGIPPDEIDLVSIEVDKKTGEACVTLKVTPEFAEALEKRASIHLHDPEQVPGRLSLGSGKAKVEFVVERPEQQPEAKEWAATERKRRSKPKGEKPNLPNH